MAQAPDQGGGGGGGGAPRQNKTVKQFTGMNTQNERSAIPEGAFHWLENIQPIGPGNLHSIPGRSGAMVEIPPFVPPPFKCLPPPQDLSVVYLIDTTEPQASDNIRRSWSYIAPNGSGEIVNMAVIDFTGAPFGVDSYSITTNATAVDVPYPPTGMDPPTDRFNLRIGISDEPTTFASKSSHPLGVWHAYYRDRLSEAHFQAPPNNIFAINRFSKQGNRMYLFPGTDSITGVNYLIEYEALTGGAFLRKSDVLYNLSTSGGLPFPAAPNFFYALVPHAGTTAIARIDYSDLQTTIFYDLPTLPDSPPLLSFYTSVYALTDDLIYVIATDITGTELGVGYWNNAGSPPEFVWVDKAVSGTIGVNFGTMFPTIGLMQDGNDTYLYYGATGSNDSTKIEKIGPILC
jgi:hypothetical protein